MADWSKPTLTDLYSDVLSYIDARLNDVAVGFTGTSANIPTGTLRYFRSTNEFQEWNGSAWVVKLLALTSGGTGSGTASGARTNLGLGTIATQNASAIAITGGTLTGISSITLSCNLLFDADGTRNLGSNTAKANAVYIKNGLVIPVGTDKYVTS